MRRNADWDRGTSWGVAVLAALVVSGLIAPGGYAQAITSDLPALPVPAPTFPAAPVVTAPPPPPAPAVPALPQAPAIASPLPGAPAPSAGGSPTGSITPLVGGSALAAAATAQQQLAGGSRSSAAAATRSAFAQRRPKGMSRKEWRARQERRWDTPLKGKELKRLRARLDEDWGCEGVLSNNQRRVLVMRAGLFGRNPATRRTIARRVNVPLRRVPKLERLGLRRLARTSMCLDQGGAALGTSVYPAAPGTSVSTVGAAGAPSVGGAAGRGGGEPGADGGAGRDRDVAEVLGAFQSGVDFSLNPLDEGAEGTPDALLAFLAVLLALLAAAALATRRGALPPVLARRGVKRDGKPLLFLDVDGVIALMPPPGSPERDLPPGTWHQFGSLRTYVSAQSRDLIGKLQRRFQIVWASGWEHRANEHLRQPLGLEEDLPVVKFGADARWGSSEWKIKNIERLAGRRRPIAWVDDTIGRRHRRWARDRDAPTLLVKTESDEGISEEHVQQLLAWAEKVGPKNGGGRFARGRKNGGAEDGGPENGSGSNGSREQSEVAG